MTQKGDLSSFITSGEELPKGGPPQGAAEYILGNPEQARLSAVSETAGMDSPERAARVLRMQAKTGLPEKAIRDNLEEVERVSASGDLDLESIRRRSPVLGKWLADNPTYLQASRDDLDTLGNVEALGRALSMGFTTGQKQVHLGRLSFRQIYGSGNTPDERLARSQLDKELAVQPRGEGFMARYVNPAAKFVGQMFESGQEALKAALVTSGGAALGTAIVSGPTAPVAVPAAAKLGFIVGGIAGYSAESFKVEAGLAYHEMSKIKGANGLGIDEGAKRGAALVVGTVNASLEMLGATAVAYPYKAAVRQWMAGVPKTVLARPSVAQAARRFGEAYAIAVASETATETVQEAVNVMAEEIAKYASDGSFTMLAEDPVYRAAAFERIADAGAETLRGMLILGTPGASIRAGQTLLDARAASQRADLYTALGTSLESSKAMERLPEQTRSLVKAMLADGPVQDLYFDLEPFVTYWQSKNVDPRQAAREIFGSTEAYDQALDTGAPLRMPTHEYATKVAPTEHNAFFSQEARRTPSEMNAREAKDLAANTERAVENEEQQMREAEARRKEVLDNVSKQLQATGYDQATAETTAQQMGSFFETLGKRLGGINPLRLFGRYGMEVGRHDEVPANAMQQKEDDELRRAQVDSPEFKAWFEGSKFVNEDGSPRSGWKAMKGDTVHMNRPIGGMTHVATDIGTAIRFSNGRPIREVYVRVTNPFDFRNSSHVNRLYNELIKPGNMQILNKQLKEFGEHFRDYTNEELYNDLIDGNYVVYEIPSVNRMIRIMGFDGVYMVEEGQRRTMPNLAVFNPGQIKSVYNSGSFNINDPDIMFQSTQPLWYSELSRKVDALKLESGTPEQWAATIKNMKGVKPAEAEWSGVYEWLAMHHADDIVTKTQVLKWLTLNGVQVQEKIYGGPGVKPERSPDDQAIKGKVKYVEDAGWSVDEAPDQFIDGPQWGIMQPEAGEIVTEASDVDTIWRQLSRQEKLDPRFSLKVKQYLKDIVSYLNEAEPVVANRPKYATYVEPGGEEYVELLLLFPQGTEFTESHYGEKGVLAHVRANKRKDESGKLGLFIEEVQSQWAQRGRREGFKDRIPENVQKYLPTQDNRVWIVDDGEGYRREYRTREEMVQVEGADYINANPDFVTRGQAGQVVPAQQGAPQLTFGTDQPQPYTQEQVLEILHHLPAVSQEQRNQGYAWNPPADLHAVMEMINIIRAGHQDGVPVVPGHYMAHTLVRDHNWLPRNAGLLQTQLASRGIIPFGVGNPRTVLSQLLFEDLVDKFVELDFTHSEAEHNATELYEKRASSDDMVNYLEGTLGLPAEIVNGFLDIMIEHLPNIEVHHRPDDNMWVAREVVAGGGIQLAEAEDRDTALELAYSATDFPDFIQQGQEGYASAGQPAPQGWDVVEGGPLTAEGVQQMAAALEPTGRRKNQKGLPAGPFVTSTDAWVALVLKRMFRYAADENLNFVAWTVGEQQTGRYEGALRKLVDHIEWEKTPEGVHLTGYKGGRPASTMPAETRRHREETLQQRLDILDDQIKDMTTEMEQLADQAAQQASVHPDRKNWEALLGGFERRITDPDEMRQFGYDQDDDPSLVATLQYVGGFITEHEDGTFAAIAERDSSSGTKEEMEEWLFKHWGMWELNFEDLPVNETVKATLRQINEVNSRRHLLTIQYSDIAMEIRGERDSQERATGRTKVVDTRYREDELSDAIGKTMAKTIFEDPNQTGVIEKKNFVIHDTGMGQFYEKIMPTIADKLLKKLGGGSVGRVKVNIGHLGEASDYDTANMVATDLVNERTSVDIINYRYGLHLTQEMVDEARSTGGLGRQNLRGQIMDQSTLGGSLKEQPGLYLTDANKEKMRESQPLFQAERGFFRTGRGRKVSIGFLQHANLSTFLHESGHFYLEVLRDVTGRASVDEVRRFFNVGPELTQEHVDALRRDVQVIFEHLGVTSWSEIKREHHEKFARTIEAYFMEGRAPSQGLRAAFSRFAAWLSALYGTLRNLGVQLNDDVRSVMDRLFATEEEIAAARQEADVDALFLSAEQAGVSEEEFQRYRERVERASRDSREELRNRLMRQAFNERTKLYKEQREAVQAEVEREVDARPEYAAIAALKKDKLDLETLEKMYPAPMADNPTMQRLRDLRLFKKRGGADPKTAAQSLGYGSADAMVSAIVTSEDRDRLVKQITDQRVREQFKDPMADGARLADEAMAAVHAEGRSQVLEAELNMLRARIKAEAPGVRVERQRQRKERVAGAMGIRQAGPDLATLRRVARGRIEQMRVGDIRPEAYLVAARRASALAKDAAAKNDWAAAALQKQRELLSTEMYREARKVRDSVEDIVDYARRFGTDRVRARLGKAGDQYLEQVDGLLERFDLSSGVSRDEGHRRENIRRWADTQRERGLPVNLPEDVLDEAYRRPYRELTFRELDGLRDSLRHIEHLSRLKNRLLTSSSRRELEAVVNEVAQQIRSTARRSGPMDVETRLPQDEGARSLAGFLASHRKLSSLAREMDGGQDSGPVWEYIVRPLNKAADAETSAHVETNKSLAEIFAPFTTLQEQAKNALTGVSMGALEYGIYAQEEVPAIGRSLSKASRLAVALNWGNETNRQRLMDGHGWSESQVEAILASLTRADWEFVQAVWDHIGSYWSRVEALSKRVDGIAPERVRPMQVQTQHGVFRGGYYPIAYDDRLSPRAFADAAKEQAQRAMQGAAVRSTTAHGFREERSRGAVKRPVRLDLNVVFEHIDEVIHDLTHYEALIDVHRIMGHQTVQAAVLEGYGAEVYAQFRSSLTDVAAGAVPAETTIDRGFQWARQGASIAAMAWNLMTGLMQPLGLTQSFVRVGPKWVSAGVMRWMRDSLSLESTVSWIHGKSEFMRNRPLTMSREVNEIRDKLGAGGAFTPLTDTYFYLITKLQMVADVPTWLGAYEKAMEEGGFDEKRAIEIADQAVRDAQGSGHVVDLARVLRGGPLLRLWTNFMSFFITTFNQTAERFRLTEFSLRDPSAFGRFAVDMLMLYTVPVIISVAIKEALRGDSEGDWEKILKRLAGEQMSYLLGTMLGAREIGAVFQGYHGWDGPAGARLFAKSAELGRQVMQGEVDRAAFKALNEVSGILLHYPAGQVQRTADGVAALMEGRTSNPFAPIVGAAPHELPK